MSELNIFEYAVRNKLRFPFRGMLSVEDLWDLRVEDLERMLDEVNITLNKNAIPFDKQKPFVTSGVRIGTPSVTTRGFKEDDCRKIAELITEIINKKEDAFEYVRAEVKKLIEKYPLYEGVIR